MTYTQFVSYPFFVLEVGMFLICRSYEWRTTGNFGSQHILWNLKAAFFYFRAKKIPLKSGIYYELNLYYSVAASETASIDAFSVALRSFKNSFRLSPYFDC